MAENNEWSYRSQTSIPGFVIPGPFHQTSSTKQKAISVKPKPVSISNAPVRIPNSFNPFANTQGQGQKTNKSKKTEQATMPKRQRDNRYTAIANDLKEKRRDNSKSTISQAFANNNGGITPTKINYGINTTMMDNPFNLGGFFEGASMAKQNNTVAVNIVNFDPTGIVNSIADKNFANIFDMFINRLQVETNASINSSFNKQNVSIYLDVLTELLDLYYEIKTLQCWNPDVDYTNQALHYLKQRLNTPDLNMEISILEDFFQGVWMPNEMVKFIVWKNQTYRLSQLANSNLMRFASSTMATGITDPNTLSATLIAKIVALKARVNAQNDTSTTITSATRSSINQALRKGFLDIGSFLLNLTIPLNSSTYDPDFTDIFRNQRSLYGTQAAPLVYPVYGDTKTISSSLDAKQISNLALALNCGLNNSSQDTGLLEEIRVTLGSISSNKFIVDYNSSNDTYQMKNRNDFRWDIVNDYNVVHQLNGNLVTKVPAGTIEIMLESKYNLNVATRMVQNQMFGLQNL